MIEICEEMLNVNDSQTKYFASFLIYNHIRKNIIEIEKNNEMYQRYKEIMINKILGKLSFVSNLDEKISLNICSGISVMLMYGIRDKWITGIKDIKNMSNLNEAYFVYSLMIFGSIAHEIESIEQSEWILEEMKKYQDIMILYIKENFPKTINDKILVKYMLNVMISFTKCDVNIIEMNHIGKEVVSLISQYDNSIRELINELIGESMNRTKNSKIYTTMDNINSIESFISKCDINEMNSINEIITILQNTFNQFKSNTEILFSISSIFSSICSNFSFFLFYHKTLLNVRQFFITLISSPILKISSLFIESLEEIKVFINYTRLLYSEEEKTSIINFLFEINDILYNNSKLKGLNVNYDSIKAYSSSMNLSGITLYNIIDNDIAMSIDDITVYQYRNIIDDTFTDILTMMISLNGASMIKSYIEHLSSFLINAEDAKKDISSISLSYLISVEAVIFNIRSIVIIFDMPNISSDILITFASFIMNSQLVLNDKIMMSFMLLLYSMSLYISSDVSFYEKSISFLLKVATSFQILSSIATCIISDIVSHSLSYNDNVFKMLCEYYQVNYTSIDYVTAGNVIESILNVLLKGNPNKDEIQKTMNAIHSVMTYEMNVKNIKKVININSKMNDILGRYDMSIIIDNIKNNCIIAYTEKIIEQFIKNSDIIQDVVIFYNQLCSIIKENVTLIYSTNEKIFNLILNNNTCDIYQIVELLIKVYTFCNSNNMITILTLLFNKVMTDASNIELLNSFVKFFILVLSKGVSNNSFKIITDILSFIMNTNKNIIDNEFNDNIIKCFITLYSQDIYSIIKLNYCESILRNILETFNHYSFDIIDSLTYLMIALYTTNQTTFNQVISQIKHGSIISQFFSIYSKIKPERIKSLVKDILLISKNKVSNEDLIMKQYEIEIKKVQIILQKYSNTSDSNIKTKYNI